MKLKKYLNHNDALLILELIDKSRSCDREDDLRDLLCRINDLTPFEFAVCGIARMYQDGALKPFALLNVNYPSEWLELYLSKEYYLIDPVVKENFSRFSVQYWTETFKKRYMPKEFISEAEDFGLSKGYTHGAKDSMRGSGSIFCFAGASVEHHERTRVILECIIPHLHDALTHILHDKSPVDAGLSKRELEVLDLVKGGKRNGDISVILGISENTVKFHLKSILRKLNAGNRSEAIAIAIDEHLIGK